MNKKELKKVAEEIFEKYNNEFLMSKYNVAYVDSVNILDELSRLDSNSQDFAYARISTKDQNILRQLDIFSEMGIDERHIFTDKQTGRTFSREGFIALKNIMRKGDRLYILDLKRFGRDYKENKTQWKEITEDIGADIIAINTPILDTTQYKSLIGNLVSDLVLSVLNYETESDYNERRINQRQGIEAWKKHGITKTGRPYGRPKIEKPDNFNEVAEKVINGELSKVEAMKQTGLKKDKFYDFYKKYTKTN